MPDKKNSFEDIYAVVRLIPEGRLTSYGAIAKYLGTGARMVGWALNACHSMPDVPAHRVLNRNGVLTGQVHFGGNRMQELLYAEGVEVQNNQAVEFKACFWSPTEELL